MQEIRRPHSRRLPVALSGDAVSRILNLPKHEQSPFAQLLYGTGKSVSETLQLRVKDVDSEHSTIVVREGKCGNDRAAPPPSRG